MLHGQREPADEQESSKYSCERQEACEAIGRHGVPLVGVGRPYGARDRHTSCARELLRIEERELEAGGLN